VRRLTGSLYTALLASTSPLPLLAQAVPDLSGTWHLQVDSSDFGQLPGIDARIDVIVHAEPRLSIKRTTTVQGSSTVADMSFIVDGQPHRNTAGATVLISTLHWEGQVLVVVSTTDGPQGQLTITDRYTLGPDARTLTQDRTLSIQGQELRQRLVLTRG
jgi:hypothetical protein